MPSFKMLVTQGKDPTLFSDQLVSEVDGRTLRKFVFTIYALVSNFEEIALANTLEKREKRFVLDETNTFHIFPVRCENRNELKEYLYKKGIETVIHYPIPPHKQEAYKEFNSLYLPITEKIHEEILSIPCHTGLKDDEIDKIVEALNDF